MALNSSIEWTDATWNPVTGCSKISPGCKHCYADRMANRLHAMGQPRYRNGFQLTLQADIITRPLSWREPHHIFVNSMSDLFHDNIPYEYINQVFDIMSQAHWHTFQVLTKRSKRLAEISHKLKWPKNVWMGVSVENADYKFRISHLQQVPAAVRFLSIEPLLSSIGRLNLNKIDWVIVGGESGPKARPMKEDWVREVRDHCIKQETPFFFKQWGGVQKKKTGRLLDGITWDEMPSIELVFV
ncbi:phage protein Gp37/Gp68 [bacterium BMS3Bbin08]|nr:phage protein Gp37/Gp68 [bacterium BMS3Bbin08]